MTYNYEDEGGWLGRGPSIGGAVALITELKANIPDWEKLYPNLDKLLTTGESDEPEMIKGDCERIISKTQDTDVKDTLHRLARAAAIAKGKITVTH